MYEIVMDINTTSNNEYYFHFANKNENIIHDMIDKTMDNCVELVFKLESRDKEEIIRHRR